MALFRFLVIISILIPSVAWGVCGGSEPNWVPADCSIASINECITEAESGSDIAHTITLPTCGAEATWGADGTTTLSNVAPRNITINGNAQTITYGGNYTWTVAPSNTKPFRITNFIFNTDTKTAAALEITCGTSSTARIDHNSWTNLTSRAIYSFMNSETSILSIDSNTFSGPTQTQWITAYRHRNGHWMWDWAETELEFPLQYGIFIEGNTFDASESTVFGDNPIDGGDGLRWIIRHNNFINGLGPSWHGLDSAGGGVRYADISYNTHTSERVNNVMGLFRDGMADIHHNVATGSYGGWVNTVNYRMWSASWPGDGWNSWARCDGLHKKVCSGSASGVEHYACLTDAQCASATPNHLNLGTCSAYYCRNASKGYLSSTKCTSMTQCEDAGYSSEDGWTCDGYFDGDTSALDADGTTDIGSGTHNGGTLTYLSDSTKNWTTDYFVTYPKNNEAAHDVSSGYHDGSDSNTILTDTDTRTGLDVWSTSIYSMYYQWVLNVTDGSGCMITTNTANTVTCAGGLTGGSDNTWQSGDEYKIHIGYWVYNLTSGAQGMITENTATTATAQMYGGTRQDWQNGDQYLITNGYPCRFQPGTGYMNTIEGTYNWNNSYKGGAGELSSPDRDNGFQERNIMVGRELFNVARTGYIAPKCPNAVADPSGLYQCDTGDPTPTGYWKAKTGGSHSFSGGATHSFSGGSTITWQ